MKLYYDTPYRKFLLAMSAFSMTSEELDECFRKVSCLAVIDKFRYDKNYLIFGKLCKLQGLKTGAQLMTQSFGIILGPPEKDYKYFNRFRRWVDKLRTNQYNRFALSIRAADALRFVLQVRDDMETIANLFEAIKYKPTPEEKKAGINNSKGSLHQVADWYARRMGYADIEQVYLLPWTRIYAALKQDIEDINFRRRLGKVIENKSK